MTVSSALVSVAYALDIPLLRTLGWFEQYISCFDFLYCMHTHAISMFRRIGAVRGGNVLIRGRVVLEYASC